MVAQAEGKDKRKVEIHKDNVRNRDIDIMELNDCLIQLNIINDNLHVARWGLAGGECIDPKTIDNALFLINQNIDRIIERMDAALTKQKC